MKKDKPNSESKMLAEKTLDFLRKRRPTKLVKLKVKKIAQKFEVDISYLSRSFKKEIGINLSVFLRHYKFLRRINKLMESNMNVGEIAGKMGYKSESHFIKVYTGIYKVTPGRIKRIFYCNKFMKELKEDINRDKCESQKNSDNLTNKNHESVIINDIC
jgi:two-component system, response regulator YesN